MAKIDPERYGVNTLAVRAGRQPTGEGEHSEPLFLTSSYVFKDAAQAAARFRRGRTGQYLLQVHQFHGAHLRGTAGGHGEVGEVYRHVFRHGRHSEYLPWVC